MTSDEGSSTPPHESLVEAFLRTASRDPDGPAWVAGNALEGRSYWTWRDLEQKVAATSHVLRSFGVGPGDRVVNLERNRAEWAILDLACSAVGAIHCPLDYRLSSITVQHCVRVLQPVCVFSPIAIPGVGTQLLDQAIHEGTPFHSSHGDWARSCSRGDDVACILFTSGTTGQPKGVMLTHRNLLANAAAKLEAMPQEFSDRRLNILPFAHAYARTCELTAWILSGGTMMCCHDVPSIPKHAASYRPTLFNAVPSVYDWLVKSTLPNSLATHEIRERSDVATSLGGCIRRLASGGAPLPAHVRRRFQEIDLPIYQGYGLTEASPVVCSNRSARGNTQAILHGVGPTVDGVTVRIDDEGRLWVKGDGVMRGYWSDPKATSERMRDGWLDTGDKANAVDVDGATQVLEIEGRCDDVQILTTGDKFSPAAFENRIAEHGIVQRCVLIGTARRTPILVVSLIQGIGETDADALLSHARAVLSDAPEYVLPGAVIVDPEPWTVANGCLHWKGHVLRAGVWSRWRSAFSD